MRHMPTPLFAQRITIKHPGYGGNNTILLLPACDSTGASGKVHYATIHSACVIIANNLKDGWLSLSRSGQPPLSAATPRNAVFWTRRASASKSARCATWRLTVVLISLVQGCYHDLWQWPVLGLHPGSLDRWYSAAFPASWLYGFAAETVLGRSQRSTFSSLWWQSRATGKHGIRQTGQQQFSWRRRAAWPLG
jgi:hypothetical protein